MNFLAHAFLARHEPALRVGGLAGDFVKGHLPAGLPPDLARGVALHRAIDGFADRHPAFQASRRRVAEGRRRYAGVLVDMFYDHLLARDWAEHADEPLAHFCADTYRLADARLAALPEGFARVLPTMRAGDWLASYRAPEAVADALARMSRHRIRRDNPLGEGFVDFELAADGFAADFRDFLPDASAFVLAWRDQNGDTR
ncbi:MAG: DUF479 domain-containing protein [Rhodocyclaceae bacterium]|nr:DUF479 domain-containing protein [Rhodocyclaceae bacterium]